jgi:hypothetical protein
MLKNMCFSNKECVNPKGTQPMVYWHYLEETAF